MKKTLTICSIFLCLLSTAQTQDADMDTIPSAFEELKDQDSQLDLPESQSAGEIELNQESRLEDRLLFSGAAQALDYYRGAPYPSAAGEALEMAFDASENKVDLLDEMMGYYEVIGDDESIAKIAGKMKNSGKYHPTIMRYQDHLLASIPDGSILITNGEWDSYPFICRNLVNERNVMMVSLKLLKDPVYRNQRLANLGLSIPENSSGSEFIKALALANPGRQIHVGLTLPKAILQDLQDQLYLNGLTFRYGAQVSADKLVGQWDEQIGKDLNAETALPTNVARLRLNYLPMLGIVHQKMKEEKENEQAERVKRTIDRICTQAGRPELKNLFD